MGVVLGAALVAGALAVAVATGLLLHDTSTPVSIADVVARFRERAGAAEGRDGVYRYLTRGEESVDVLGGAHHRYPRTTSITVVGVPCGTRLQWEPLKEGKASWTLCTTARGVELQGSSVSHRFFGQSDTTTYDCGGSVLLPAQESAGATSPFHCRSSRGRETGTARVLGFEAIAVGGKPLDAVHVRTAATVMGGDTGREVTDWWFDVRDGLPLRIALLVRGNRSILIGTVHYREDATLLLLSTTPLR